jgi:hypothetical protein
VLGIATDSYNSINNVTPENSKSRLPFSSLKSIKLNPISASGSNLNYLANDSESSSLSSGLLGKAAKKFVVN